MRPLAFTLPYVIVFVAVSIWGYVAEARLIRKAIGETASARAPQDKGSLAVVMLTQSLAFAAAFFLAWTPFGRVHDQRIIFWIGIAVWVAGAVLRRLCFRALGQSFTGEVRVRSEQRVITSGPYRWVRHPAYTAGTLMIVGVALTLGTWLGALIALPLTLVGYGYRVQVEERALTETLGPAYRDYASRTKRFIPFIV